MKNEISPLNVAKFWSHVALSADPKACWMWKGPFAHTGYGVFSGESARWFAWRLAGGRGTHKILKTKCLNGDCVRPSHITTSLQKANDHRSRTEAAAFQEFRQKHSEIKDMAVAMREFSKHWGENSPPWKSEVPVSDTESIEIKLI